MPVVHKTKIMLLKHGCSMIKTRCDIEWFLKIYFHVNTFKYTFAFSGIYILFVLVVFVYSILLLILFNYSFKLNIYYFVLCKHLNTYVLDRAR